MERWSRLRRSASARWLGLAAPVDALAAATPYLRLLASVVAGWLLGRQAQAAHAGAADDAYLAAKVATARYFCTQVLPTAAALVPAVTAGAAVLVDIPAAALRGS